MGGGGGDCETHTHTYTNKKTNPKFGILIIKERKEKSACVRLFVVVFVACVLLYLFKKIRTRPTFLSFVTKSEIIKRQISNDVKKRERNTHAQLGRRGANEFEETLHKKFPFLPQLAQTHKRQLFCSCTLDEFKN